MTGLVGWWPLHETSGNTANDLSGNGNHGSLNGGVTRGVEGKSGLTAYNLDGSDDEIVVNNGAAFDYNFADRGLTFSLWIKPGTIPSGRTGIYDFDGIANGWTIYMSNGSELRFLSRSSGSPPVSVANVLETRKWHHITGTFDPDYGTDYGALHLYHNGNHIDTQNVDAPPDNPQGGNQIGRDSNKNWNYYNGNISNLRVYNRPLTPQEVQELYDQGSKDFTNPNLSDGNDSGAISRLKFDNANSDSSVAEDSWGSNDASISGGSYTDNSIRGKAISLTASDYVEDSDFASPTSSITVSLWTKPDWASSDNYCSIITNGRHNSSWTIRQYDGDNTPFFNVNTPNGASGTTFKTLASEWYHLAATYDGSKVKTYVNGTLQNTEALSGDINTTSNSLRIGWDDASDEHYAGIIDDVRIYSRRLKTHEIFELYRWGTKGIDMRKKLVNQKGGV